jgi:hypothetical protein
MITNNPMNQDDFVIFAELNWAKFDLILKTLMDHFENIEYGRQGDDWIWIPLVDDKIEIDSFYSMNLDLKGKYDRLPFVRQIIQELRDNWILEVFDPPKIDMTR